MNIAKHQTENLDKGLSLFIESIRTYISTLLQKEAGARWPAWFAEALLPDQKRGWDIGLRSGTPPEVLIDYPYLKAFALKYKNLLKPDFGKEVNNLATWFDTIYKARNKSAHYNDITADSFAETFIQMKAIARALKAEELEKELAALQQAGPPEAAKTVSVGAGSQPWFRTVTPHLDIREGRLDESVFAANLSEVALDTGREVYRNPQAFFSKTFPTAGLKNVARTVIKGLNGKEDAENRVIALQTGFGGGKTHTLISLYHIAKWGKGAAASEAAKELLAYTGLPEFESANIAVFTNTTNDPAQGRTTDDGTHIKTIWGELAYQLGGKEAYELIRKNDEDRTAPKGTFKQVLERCQPALILIDELADYCVSASTQKIEASNLSEQTVSFMQELTQSVASATHCVSVVTLPASPEEVGNTVQAQNILSSLQKRVGRIGKDMQPVADEEIYEVVRRRLFEEVGDAAQREAVVSKYIELYNQQWPALPSHVVKGEYKSKMLKSYPFHPELIDVFRIRWASHHDFQRTRGALRLLAAIVSDLWKRQGSLPGGNLLIHAGDINIGNLDALSSQLKKLYGNGYDAVISADVSGGASNAFKIDGAKPEYKHWDLTQSIASVILMNSFGSDGVNKGVSVRELKLNLLQPGGFNHNLVNSALDDLEDGGYYLYYTQGGGDDKRYWFHTKPNINILINGAKADIKPLDVDAEIIRRIKEKEKFFSIKALIEPDAEIPEQLHPTLLILSPKHAVNADELNGRTKPLIEKLATKKASAERIYRNTLLFLLPTELGLSKLQSCVRDYLSCGKISSEYNSQLEKEQREELKRRMGEAGLAADNALTAAYSLLVKHRAKTDMEKLVIKEFKDSFDRQVNEVIVPALKREEWLLEKIGLSTLRNTGLLPTVEQPVKAKDVYEAFIRFDDKPMITGVDAVQESLLGFCRNGQFCIASGDGKTFTSFYLKESVPYFDVKEDSWWLVDASAKPVPAPPTGEPSPEEGIIKPGEVAEGPASLTPKPTGEAKVLKSVTISGKVPVEQYTQLFNSFVMPLAQNNIEIEIRIKAKSTSAKPLTESSQEYKIVKESAKQLGLQFDEEL